MRDTRGRRKKEGDDGWTDGRVLTTHVFVKSIRAAPIGPARLPQFVVVFFREDVYDGMNETEYDTFRDPVDDDINGHVVFVNRYPFRREIRRIRRG